jgi:exosortase/archaeosortase
MKLLFNYLKKIFIFNLLNLIIAVLIALIKNSLTVDTIAKYVSIGGLVMLSIAGLSFLGSSRIAQQDMSSSYARSAGSTSFNNAGMSYMNSRDRGIKFMVLMALSGLPSLIIGNLINPL